MDVGTDQASGDMEVEVSSSPPVPRGMTPGEYVTVAWARGPEAYQGARARRLADVGQATPEIQSLMAAFVSSFDREVEAGEVEERGGQDQGSPKGNQLHKRATKKKR